MDGMRDFREVVYIQHDGDEIITSELTDDEFEDDDKQQDKFKEFDEESQRYVIVCDLVGHSEFRGLGRRKLAGLARRGRFWNRTLLESASELE